MKTPKTKRHPTPAKSIPQVVLLRVGIDTGSGGILGPIFNRGLFEFVPIDSSCDSLNRTYGNTSGRFRRKLIEYFPAQKREKMKNCFLHFDPEFKSFTYGDPTRPKQSLRSLKEGAILVFYAGLTGWDVCKTAPGLYIIGYFVIERAGRRPDLKKNGGLDEFALNWHVLNADNRRKLILVKGGKGSRLLKKAIRISALKRAKDAGGHPVYVLDSKLNRHFGSFTRLNAIQRSIPRWINEEFCQKAANFVLKLK